MSAILRENSAYQIHDEIKSHPAWKGSVSGLTAEKMLRGKDRPYLYVLRTGETEHENESDYYVTFIHSDLTVRHQPFVITTTPEGWCYENASPGGHYSYHSHTINDVLHLIMHCSKKEPLAFTLFLENA